MADVCAGVRFGIRACCMRRRSLSVGSAGGREEDEGEREGEKERERKVTAKLTPSLPPFEPQSLSRVSATVCAG